MRAVTIRNLPEEVHRAIKMRAALHNRSTEAEMRAILENSVLPTGRLQLGTYLAEASKNLGLTNSDIESIDTGRNAEPAKPLDLG